MNDNLEKMRNILKEKNIELSKITCCFTGHRPQKLPWGFNEDDEHCIEMKRKIKQAIINSIKNGYINFITGMALGFDMICAEIVLELKKSYPHIKLIAALPCKDQYKVWKTEQIERYKEILSHCDCVRCLYNKYIDNCMLERNDFMLNNSSLVIALYDGKGGGTGYTVRNAKQKGLEIIIIEP